METLSDAKNEKVEKIVKTAREVFFRDGLFQSRIEDISAESGISRRTIYRYCNCKDELAILVMVDMFKEWNGYQKEFYQSTSGNGYERLSQFLTFLVSQLDEMREPLIYANEFDRFIALGDIEKTSTDSYQQAFKEFRQLTSYSERLLEEMIVTGKEDGSLKADINERETACSLGFTLMSIALRLTNNREILIEETDSLILKVLDSQKNLYLDALRNI